MGGITVAQILVGGGCAALGGIVVAIINGIFGRSEKKATAASQLADADKKKAETTQIVSEAAAAVASQFQRDNESLRLELRGVKDAIETLVDKVDEVIPLLETAGHAEVAVTLRDANRGVRRVI